MRVIGREKLIEVLEMLDEELVCDIDIQQMFLLYGEELIMTSKKI